MKLFVLDNIMNICLFLLCIFIKNIKKIYFTSYYLTND